MKCAMLAVSIFSVCMCMQVAQAAQKTGLIKMVTIDFPPFAIHRGGVAAGLGVDILNAMLKITGIETTSVLIQVDKLIPIAESQAAVFPVTVRSPEREKFFRWIGKIDEDRFCFVTLKSEKPVSTIDEAKQLKSIGVNRGGATELSLRKRGVENIDVAMGNGGNVRKLFAHKIDAWFASERISAYSVSQEHQDPSQIVCSGNLGHLEYWITASKTVSDEQFKALQNAFSQLDRDGAIKELDKKYR